MLVQSRFPTPLEYPPYPPYPVVLAAPPPTFPPKIPFPYTLLLPLFFLSYTNIPIAPMPALAANAKKLNRENPTLWSFTPSTGRPTMPGSIVPSIQPTSNLSTNGSFLTILVPSLATLSEVLGKLYAVDANRCAGSVAFSEV